MRTIVALLVLSAGAELVGPPLRQDGLMVRPPRAFRLARMDLFHGTRVIGEASKEGVSRYLTAALMDGDGEDASSMLVSIVEESLRPGPNARDEAATNVTRHLRDDLGLDFTLERADVVTGPAGRVEVRGQVREGAQLRKLLIARYFGDPRHAVVVFSVPSGRWDALGPALTESLDSVRMEQPSGTPRSLALALAVLVGAALLASVGLWRRRRARREGAS
ncbi:MAG: hypothetical protein SFW67_28845 [Myxococcaceae bacterium]|nr:hypothetical protein [Myxococcaceae bacterium]